MKRLAILLTALAALAGIAAGCGGGGGGGSQLSKEEYQQKVEEVGKTLEPAFTELGSSLQELAPESISSVSDLTDLFDQMADKLRGLGDELDSAADSLADIEPPADVAGAQATLEKALRATADEFDEFADVVAKGDLNSIQEFSATLADFGSLEAGKLFQQAMDAYEAAGYDIGG